MTPLASARAYLPLAHSPHRPERRGECAELPRPCPFPACRYHLAPDSRDGSPFLYSCALDAADDGGHTLDEVAEILGTSPESVRDLEAEALRKLRRALGRDRAGPAR